MDHNLKHVIDINIHLDSQHIPDPVGYTDYIVIVLGAFFVGIVLVFNVILYYLSSRWIPVVTKNIPLVYLMSLASIIHIVSVFLNESFFFHITQRIQAFSCVFFYFWLEYLLGLGSFLCILALRLLTLLFIVIPSMRPRPGENRKFALKALFVTMFMLPILDICLLVTVNHADEYTPPSDLYSIGMGYGYCETPNKYKIPLVSVLIFYIFLLIGMTVLLNSSGHNLQQTPIIVDIVTVAIPLLIIASILHFTYTLTYWWGRFIFMLTVMFLHMYSYGRIVFPDLFGYFTQQGTVADSKKMQIALKNIKRDMESESIKLDISTLQRYRQIRDDFFNKCLEWSKDKLYLYEQSDLIDAEYDDYDNGIPISRLIDFYNELDNLFSIVSDICKMDEHRQSGLLLRRISQFRENHKRFLNRFIDSHSTSRSKPIPIDNDKRSRITHGFENDDKDKWDEEILSIIMKEILNILIVEFAQFYYGSIDLEIYRLRDQQISDLRNITADDIYASWYDDPDDHIEESFGDVVLHTLAKGSGKEETIYFRQNGIIEDEEDEIVDNRTPSEIKLATEFTELKPEEQLELLKMIAAEKQDRQFPTRPIHLTDGSVIYTTPFRAFIAFWKDLACFFISCPALCKEQYEIQNRKVLEEISAAEDRKGLV